MNPSEPGSRRGLLTGLGARLRGAPPVLSHRARQMLNLLLVSGKVLAAYAGCLRPGSRRRIVAIAQVEHLGDIVACEPVTRQVRRQYPDATVIFFVKKAYRELVDANPHVDVTASVTCLTTWVQIKKIFPFDAVFDLHLNGRICTVCKVPLVNNDADGAITFWTYYLFGPLLPTFCRVAGLAPLYDQPVFRVPTAALEQVAALALPPCYLVVHCQSNEAARDWSLERWNELIDLLGATPGGQVVEVGHRSQLGRSDSGHYRNLCGKLSIPETAAVISRARLFVGIDSGPAHLANAVGTFGVVLLGEYNLFSRYLPYTGGYGDGSNSRLVYADGPASTLSVAAVHAEIAAALENGQNTINRVGT